MSVFSHFPSLQEVLEVGEGLIDLAQWQRDAILVIPTALLPVFFGDLLIEEAEPGHRAQLHHVDYYYRKGGWTGKGQ